MSTYKYIVNPENGKRVSVFSKKGLKIINSYLQLGGSDSNMSPTQQNTLENTLEMEPEYPPLSENIPEMEPEYSPPLSENTPEMEPEEYPSLSEKNPLFEEYIFYRIQTYFSTNDLNEEYINRYSIIEQIFQKYRIVYESGEFYEPENSLYWIYNDILGLIGTHQDLIKNNTEGEKLWEFLDDVLGEGRYDIPDEQLLVNIKILLMNVPLYFLMSFLGYASDKEHNAKAYKEKQNSIEEMDSNEQNKIISPIQDTITYNIEK